MYLQLQFKTITIDQCGSLVEVKTARSSSPLQLTHRDLNGAVFLSHIVACRAPVDTRAIHCEIPQGDDLWVLQICQKKFYIITDEQGTES